MLSGICPKCGYQCVGWALQFPRNQACPKCGSGLDIMQNGRKVADGYSPFTAEEYNVEPTHDAAATEDRKKDSPR